MRSYRFEVGTGRGLIILNITAKEELSGRLKTEIMIWVAFLNGCCYDDTESLIRSTVSRYGEEVDDIQVSEVSDKEFNIVCIDDILCEAKNGELICDADEIYIIMAATGNYDKKYAAFVGFNVIDEDTRLLRAAAQNINLRNGSHKFDFIFSNAYPTNDSGSLLDLELDSTTEIVIPIKAKSDYLYYVLLRLFYVRCVKRGIEEIKGVGQPLFSSKFSKYR